MRRRSGFGWMECIEGVLLLGLGSYTFAQPDRALTGFIVMYGIVAVTMGIADILLYVRVERFTGFGPIVSLISGALSVMTGVMLLVYPNAGKWVMSLLFPLWFLAHCIGRLSGLHTVRLWAGDFECARPDPRRSDAGRSAGLVAVRPVSCQLLSGPARSGLHHSGLQQARLQRIECYAGGCSFRLCIGRAAAILPPLCRFDFCLLFGASDACKAASGVVN